MKALDLNNVISDIKTIITKEAVPIKRVGVYGSLVKGQINNDSDIDIAVEYDYKQGDEINMDKFIEFCEVCESLSEGIFKIYNRKVDVVHVEDKPDSFLRDIQGEVVWV